MRRRRLRALSHCRAGAHIAAASLVSDTWNVGSWTAWSDCCSTGVDPTRRSHSAAARSRSSSASFASRRRSHSQA